MQETKKGRQKVSSNPLAKRLDFTNHGNTLWFNFGAIISNCHFQRTQLIRWLPQNTSFFFAEKYNTITARMTCTETNHKQFISLKCERKKKANEANLKKTVWACILYWWLFQDYFKFVCFFFHRKSLRVQVFLLILLLLFKHLVSYHVLWYLEGYIALMPNKFFVVTHWHEF